MKDINKKYADIVRERYEENVISGLAAKAYMESSTAIYKGVPVDCLYLPKIFSKEAHEYLKQSAQTMYRIIEKVIQRYLDDENYRKLFPFPKELEDLILIEAGYPCLLPIARIDIFFNEEDFSFKYCEFNADGASAMNEDRELGTALKNSDALVRLSETCEISPFEYFDSWVREFADIYSSYDKKVASPRIIITDFMEGAIATEFTEFKKAFVKAGYDTDICEIRDLIYEDGQLKTPDGKKVDAVYRRAVTRDVMEHKEEIEAFITAARERAVCIIGHFRTQVIHNKTIFLILRHKDTLAFLTEAEQEYVLRHIPETLKLNTGEFDLEAVVNNKDKWIIKPEDMYASKGVYAGMDFDKDTWLKTVKEAMDTGYLLQEYHIPYKSENLNFNKSARPGFETYNNITGMYMYNGKLQGFYSRAGQKGTISSAAGGLTLLSLLATEKK